jgi:hypothetical protein
MTQKTNPTTSTTPKTTVLVPPAHPIAPRLYYLPHVWNQIQYIVQASPQEVGWWGLVEKVETDYVVTALYVPEQTVSAAETDITAETMGDLAMEVLAAGLDPSKLYYWGHSHVNMGVSPSGQDETQVRDYLVNCPVFIRGIYNKAGASKVDIYDVEQNVCFESVTNVPAHPQLTKDDKAALDALLKTNVKKQTLPVYNGYGGYGNRNQWGYPDTGKKNTPVATENKKRTTKPTPTTHLIGNVSILRKL